MWDVSKGNKMPRKMNFWTLVHVLCGTPNTSHQRQEGPGDGSKTPAVHVFLCDVKCYLSLSPFAHSRCRWNILSRAQHHWILVFAPHPLVISVPSGGKSVCVIVTWTHTPHSHFPHLPLLFNSLGSQQLSGCWFPRLQSGLASGGITYWHSWLHDAHSGMSNAWLSGFLWPSLFSRCLFFIALYLCMVSPTN